MMSRTEVVMGHEEFYGLYFGLRADSKALELIKDRFNIDRVVKTGL